MRALYDPYNLNLALVWVELDCLSLSFSLLYMTEMQVYFRNWFYLPNVQKIIDNIWNIWQR